MSSKSDICNQALSNIEISQFVSNIDTDRSNEAIVCKRWYDISVDVALRRCDWNFARRRVALALLATPVPSEWAYTYVYPTDCLVVRRLQPFGIHWPTKSQKILFEPAGENQVGADVRVIYTNQAEAVAVYTKRLTDPSLFDPDFVLALGYLLAANIALPLAAKPAYVEQMRNAYTGMISEAAKLNFEEGEEGPEPASETEQARNS
jgi:hypothetical protein